jgi:hypothetical protein
VVRKAQSKTRVFETYAFCFTALTKLPVGATIFITEVFMKTLLGFLLFIASQNAFASTKILFGTDKATILIQGKPGEVEPIEMFTAMKVAEVDDGQYLVKSAELTGAKGQKVLAVSCKVSKSVENFGSCAIVIPRSAASNFDKVKKQLTMMVQYPESVSAARVFQADQDGHIFFSDDRHLGLVIDFSNAGTPMSFRLFYI